MAGSVGELRTWLAAGGLLAFDRFLHEERDIRVRGVSFAVEDVSEQAVSAGLARSFQGNLSARRVGNQA